MALHSRSLFHSTYRILNHSLACSHRVPQFLVSIPSLFVPTWINLQTREQANGLTWTWKACIEELAGIIWLRMKNSNVYFIFMRDLLVLQSFWPLRLLLFFKIAFSLSFLSRKTSMFPDGNWQKMSRNHDNFLSDGRPPTAQSQFTGGKQ